MGFWDTLGNVITSFGEMNKEAISDAAKLSTDELCQKVNSINVLMNPLIFHVKQKSLDDHCNTQLFDFQFFYNQQEYMSCHKGMKQLGAGYAGNWFYGTVPAP